jgi:L-iditol 2-dehydrogenase
VRAAVLEKPYSIAIRDVPLPERQEGWPLLKVLRTGICGSELHSYHGVHPARVPPCVMGHEVSAVVEEASEGAGATPAGTRVAVMPQLACGRCAYCRNGEPNLCDRRIMMGTKSWPGSHAEYFRAPASLLFALPDEVSDDGGALIEPLAVAVHAVRMSGLQLGDSVVVQGSGAIGLMIVVAARAAGASRVLATDVRDFNLARARELGATHLVNAMKDDVVAAAKEMTAGLGADRTFMAAEAPGLLEQAIGATRKRGTIALVAMFTKPSAVNLQPSRVAEQRLVGSTTYDETDFRTAVELARHRDAQLTSMVTHHLNLSETDRAFEIVESRSEDVVRVMLRP